MRRGEVWWSAPVLAGGSRKRLPFLVVSNDAFNANAAYPKVMAVHLTTARHTSGPYTWEVELPRGAAGLRAASTVKCGEVYTLLKEHLHEIAGTVPAERMRAVDAALRIALALG